jgi:hypothetical protein
MKKTLLFTSAIFVGWAAYSIAPDMWRYWKLHSM